jgi:hypothetical protein
MTMQTGIQKLSNLDAVIISQSNPDQNFYGESLDLTDSMLLIKPGFNKDEVYVSELILNLTLSGTYDSGQFYIGKIQNPWDITTVTYNTRPQIEDIREISFDGGDTFEIDATQEANSYGIILWGGDIVVSMVSQILTVTPTVFNLPSTVAANRKVTITWKRFKTDYYIRRIILTRNDIEVLNTEDINSQYVDEAMEYDRTYVYKIYAVLS